MLVLAPSDISQPPEGNSNSLLTETLIASCMREICTFLPATSAPIALFSSLYCCSSSAFFCWDSSYVCFDTQPAIRSAAVATHNIGNFSIAGSPCRWKVGRYRVLPVVLPQWDLDPIDSLRGVTKGSQSVLKNPFTPERGSEVRSRGQSLRRRLLAQATLSAEGWVGMVSAHIGKDSAK